MGVVLIFMAGVFIGGFGAWVLAGMVWRSKLKNELADLWVVARAEMDRRISGKKEFKCKHCGPFGGHTWEGQNDAWKWSCGCGKTVAYL